MALVSSINIDVSMNRMRKFESMKGSEVERLNRFSLPCDSIGVEPESSIGLPATTASCRLEAPTAERRTNVRRPICPPYLSLSGMMQSTDSFVIHDDISPSSDLDEIDSLPSISSSVLDSEDDSDAQEEWERSLEQIQLLLTMVIVPFAGKYLGRKFAYWSWSRYMEWMHNVEVRWTNKGAFKAAGVAEAAATL
ncbi:Uncharacterized protein CGGC5_v006115 [Colletotrichum fructicola Nara gc5]|uniref:Uncharacterized protein n=5 Tax=Colletotrichum gloeosporioides species complex TaxID=2707338 RepID=A0A7J6JC64_COLFN|nr:Uncharacterized protein CGGC5_v006115 [Colletotrichum fructicola Nara gc5]